MSLLFRSLPVPHTGARYLRHGDAIWEFPTTRYVEGMLNEHAMKNAKPVVTPALARNDDDEEEEEASTEEHRILRRFVGKTQFLAPRRPNIAFTTNRLGSSLAKPSKADTIASKRLLRYLCGTMDLGLSVHRQRLGGRQTHGQVRASVGDHAGWILAQCRCMNTVGDR